GAPAGVVAADSTADGNRKLGVGKKSQPGAKTAARRSRAAAVTADSGLVASVVVANAADHSSAVTGGLAPAVVGSRPDAVRPSVGAVDRYPSAFFANRGADLFPTGVENAVAGGLYGFRGGRGKRGKQGLRRAGGADHQRGDAEIGDGCKQDEAARRKRTRPSCERGKLDHGEDVSS